MSDEEKGICFAGNPYYGTFQGVANYYHRPSSQPPPPYPAVDFPLPVVPPGATVYPTYYPLGYHQIVPPGCLLVVKGLVVVDGRPVRERRLPCCGLGMGWVLFLIGFFLGGIPWYVGTIILLCVQVDYREKPGYVACAIVTIIALIAVTLGVTKATHAW